mmetsp:Transcript_89685/g.252865  ORF Transcript_89685/g.252865 Transcript_89685/m.252865 type:complete len:251 (-) Transcript_89685:456-1208(-)
MQVGAKASGLPWVLGKHGATNAVANSATSGAASGAVGAVIGGAALLPAVAVAHYDGSAAAGGPAPEEGEMAAEQKQAHGALETPAQGRRWQQVDVRALNGPGRLPHLPLSKNCACLGAESYTAATTALEIDDGEAKVVGVSKDFDLHVYADVGATREQISAKTAPAVRHVVCVRHVRDHSAMERRAEVRRLRMEHLQAALQAPKARCWPRPHIPLGLEGDETTGDVELHAVERAVRDAVPRTRRLSVLRQ